MPDILDIPDRRATKASKTVPEAGSDNSKLLVDGVMPVMVRTSTGEYAPEDKFSIYDEDYVTYGIDPMTHFLVYRQDPDVYKRSTGIDAIRQVKRLGGEAVMDPETKERVILQDLVLCKVPLGVRDDYDARNTAEEKEYLRHDSEGDWEGQFDAKDAEAIERRARANSERNKQQALIGDRSPTSGWDYETAKSKFTPEQIEKEEARYRRGPRHISAKEAANMMADAAVLGEKGQRSFVGRGAPAPKNLMSQEDRAARGIA